MRRPSRTMKAEPAHRQDNMTAAIFYLSIQLSFKSRRNPGFSACLKQCENIPSRRNTTFQSASPAASHRAQSRSIVPTYLARTPTHARRQPISHENRRQLLLFVCISIRINIQHPRMLAARFFSKLPPFGGLTPEKSGSRKCNPSDCVFERSCEQYARCSDDGAGYGYPCTSRPRLRVMDPARSSLHTASRMASMLSRSICRFLLSSLCE